ncbi:DNA gyrase subunit B, partial [Escherichia coli]|nr:DNA gyrase subunit B [Escherichia coli]
YPRALVHELIYTSRLTAEQCHDAAAVQAWTKQLVEQLNAKEVGASQYSYEVELHAELGLSLPKIIVRTHGVTHEHALSVDFLNSKEYGKLADLSEVLDGLLEEGAYIKRGERTLPVSSFAEALEWLVKESMRGLSRQRYKGLG